VKLIRKRLTYANVMSSIAVFLILGGATAFAASKIGTKQLKANAVTTGKIKKEAVTTAKIKKGAVTGAKINLSTVGTVPSATSAGNANTVGGNSVVAINFSGNPTLGPTQILNLNGFTLTATCSAGEELSVVANGPSGSRLQSVGAESESVGAPEVTDPAYSENLAATPNKELLSEDDDQVVGNTQLYLGTGGRNVSITWQAESFSGIPSPHCAFTGYAIG
jgi:hypothetical protein